MLLYLVSMNILIIRENNFILIDVILIPSVVRTLTAGLFKVISLEIQVLVVQVFDVGVVRGNDAVLISYLQTRLLLNKVIVFVLP